MMRGGKVNGMMRGGPVKMMRGGKVNGMMRGGKVGYMNGGCVMAGRGVRDTNMS